MENENLQTMEDALAKSKKRLAYGSRETGSNSAIPPQ